MAILEHQIRVIQELEQIETLHKDLTAAFEKLKDRSQKLNTFVQENPLFLKLETAEQDRLKSQLFAMLNCGIDLHHLTHDTNALPRYIQALKDRIAAF